MEKQTYPFKIVMIGRSDAGKTSLIYRFTKDAFNPQVQQTIGAANTYKILELPNCRVKFEIWDTAGQEAYATLVPMYYRSAQCVLIVYDITQIESYRKALTYVEEVRQNGAPGCIIVLVGNKSDLFSERKVERNVAESFANKEGLIWDETSAKTGDGVAGVFQRVAERLTLGKGEVKDDEKKVVDVKNDGVAQAQAQKGCC